MIGAYYNEFDPDAAAWLRELIAAGLIPAGDVDEQSILNVQPDDLRGYAQCHFFAGIPDDANVWTGSPPCQPFSSAGLQRGHEDERHLAPHFAGLVGAVRPALLFGEQVSSSAVFGKAAGGARGKAAGQPQWAWIDDLLDRLEATRYAVGASDIPAAGIGAPHIRQRTFFTGIAEGMADRIIAGLERQPRHGDGRDESGRIGAEQAGSVAARGWADGAPTCNDGTTGQSEPRPTNGFWADADWLFCRDGKWRPVEPGTSPLAHGVSARVVRLRGYGNAISPQVAATFIRSTLEALIDMQSEDAPAAPDPSVPDLLHMMEAGNA